jgi:hypothetical protein
MVNCGKVDVYDADAIDAAGLRDAFWAAINSPYEHSILGKRVYTAYSDNRSPGISYWSDDYEGPKDVFDAYVLASWEVWI